MACAINNWAKIALKLLCAGFRYIQLVFPHPSSSISPKLISTNPLDVEYTCNTLVALLHPAEKACWLKRTSSKISMIFFMSLNLLFCSVLLPLILRFLVFQDSSSIPATRHIPINSSLTLISATTILATCHIPITSNLTLISFCGR